MDILACARTNLFLGVFLAAISDSRADWTGRNSSGKRISAGSGQYRRARALLVRADAAVVQHKFAPVDGAVLGGADCIRSVDAEHLAARDAGDLLGVLPFVCGRSSRIFRISVRRNAVGSGIYFVVFCSAGMAPGIRTIEPADTRELVPFALGMVPDLLRIGRGKNRQRRPAVAPLHGDGRVLPERSAANMDRVVRTTFSALVSRGVGIRDARAGIGVGVDAVPAETMADCLLFHRDAVAGGDHSDGRTIRF